ncbi:MAG: hypothetical protein GY842_16150 [bacterium]|nr:hypothetical protein [bacterium]
MADLATRGGHTFHIPIMGSGFTIDTPLRVARYGITSAISLVDDVLIEQMREIHCKKAEEPYEEIGGGEEDARARRITAYLNLLDRLVGRQVEALRASPFEAGSEITRYYEMLPETPLKRAYLQMLATEDPTSRARQQDELRRHASPGAIQVNVMTKLDRDIYHDGNKLTPEFADAMAALRGYANSSLTSSIIFSAGMNQRVYTYATQFADFSPDQNGVIKKRIILKVSDWRSAMIQGKFLAKRGLWVSEFRIESGLNCGGHAFATTGLLMGPIMEEFKRRRVELQETLHAAYSRARTAVGGPSTDTPLDMRITAQGGLGTADENELLLQYYRLDSTGWATPFLLVPEVTTVDDAHLRKLLDATDRDVHLSDASPMGIPFWTLRDSASEETRRQRILDGKPGSPCPKGFLVSNTEFTDTPICGASRAYQRRKLESLAEEGYSAKQLSVVREGVLAKACICHEVGGTAMVKNGIDPEAHPAICCGPNIVNFSKLATLQEMVSHIYGRLSLLTNSDRPHMFIRELAIYVDHLRKEFEKHSLDLSTRAPAYYREFKENLLSGIEYYRSRAEQVIEEKRNGFLDDLRSLRETLERMTLVSPVKE